MFNEKEYQKKYRQEHRECHNESNRKYYKKHKEYINKHNKEYYQKNKERELTKKKEWFKNNPEYKKEYNKKWREEHNGYIREYDNKWMKTEKGKASNQRKQSKRQAIFREILNTLTAQEWIDILREYHFKCVYCGKEFNLFDRPERDHVLPISKGGDNTKSNIVPACRSCNARKGNKISNYKGGNDNE